MGGGGCAGLTWLWGQNDSHNDSISVAFAVFPNMPLLPASILLSEWMIAEVTSAHDVCIVLRPSVNGL